MGNDIAIVDHQPIDVFNADRFGVMVRVAEMMADAPMCPESLRGFHEGTGNNKQFVSYNRKERVANCFMVVEQAAAWRVSPFAIAQAVSFVRGKLMWEGKVIAGMVQKNLGIRLNYEWTGQNEQMTVRVFGRYPSETEEREVTGTVEGWKTDGAGSPWRPANYRRQLAYRGMREWARLHAPAIMVGIVTDDEDLEAGPARPEPPKRLTAGFVEAPISSGTQNPPKSKKAAPAPIREQQEDANDAADHVTGEIIDQEDGGGEDDDQTSPVEKAQRAFAEQLHDAKEFPAIKKAYQTLAAAYQAAGAKPNDQEVASVNASCWSRYAETFGPDGAVDFTICREDMIAFTFYLDAVNSADALKAVWFSVQTGEKYAALPTAARSAMKAHVNKKLENLQ